MNRLLLSAAFLAAASLAALHGPAARGQSLDESLFDDAALQRVDLFVHSRDWYFLKANYQTNEYYPANLRWRGQTVRNVAIRSRGLGSRSQVKPGLRVDFNRFTTGQRFLGLKAIVLDNLAQDASLLHELLAMKLFRRLGAQAPRESLAALYVNNEFAGVYAIVEEPDDVAMRRMFGEGDGYLYEYSWTTEYRFEDLGPDLERYRALFQPRTHELESATALFEPIAAMVRAFNESSDEAFEESASAYLDFAHVIQHTAVQAYLAELDGFLGYAGLSNFYLYRPVNGRRFRIVPWDEDNAFFWARYPIDAGHAQNVLMRRLMERPAWREAYFAAVLAVAASAEEGAEEPPDTPGVLVGGWLEREAARLQALVREAALADRLKPFTNEEFEAASAAAVAFARERGAFVRSEVTRLTR
jgi:spore coat protein CotH